MTYSVLIMAKLSATTYNAGTNPTTYSVLISDNVLLKNYTPNTGCKEPRMHNS